jgi:hypothetical protein
MTRQMTPLLTIAAAIAVTTPLAVFTPSAGASGPPGGGASGPSGGTFVPMAQIFRRCDFSSVNSHGPTEYGVAHGVLRASGNTVVVDVQIATARPNTHYDVRVIQVPRPSSATCFGGDPGVAIGALNTDAAGAAAATVEGPIQPWATGAWVYITRPDFYSHHPAAFYSSDLVAPI